MPVLSSGFRKQLENSVLAARRAAEGASRAAVESLGVFADRRPEHLNAAQAALRVGLRAKWRQLGGDRDLLVAECAYEQWHRLLFARFLAENGLLLHPQYKAPMTLVECEELATELSEPDGWAVAARFAAEILPGIFRLDDPCVRIRLAPEGRHALEELLAGLPAEVFIADDSLGWVYQFWQKDKKDEINNSERKIGGADLGPVTQLFTENYMVRFLLENSLGAWWAARHPDSTLVKGFEYLRFREDGSPAAGSFEEWPERIAEVTVMDPCCGSGHFLVEAFSMLWQMRSEEEGLSAVQAQDAVLRDNLFGLELDPRCVQIAMFAVAMQAWKAGAGWRQLPVPNIACSGIPVRAPVEEWKALADGDERLENALVRLHILFRDADTLGSLIDPKRVTDVSDRIGLQLSFEDVDWDDISPLLQKAVQSEADDPATAVLGADAAGIARAADLLSGRHTLVVTNVPYLGLQAAESVLVGYCDSTYPDSAYDLATVFLERCVEMLSTTGGSVATVTQLNWAFLARFAGFRRKWLRQTSTHAFAILGAGAFSAISGEVVQALLTVCSPVSKSTGVLALDLRAVGGSTAKSAALKMSPALTLSQSDLRSHPDTLLSLGKGAAAPLSDYADSWQGLVTGDRARFIFNFWEVSEAGSGWEPIVTAPGQTRDFCGRDCFLRWDDATGPLVKASSAHNFNPLDVLGNEGVLVSEGNLSATRYLGEFFNQASVPIIPRDKSHLTALWCFVSSTSFATEVRRINNKIIVGAGYMLKVPFDVDYWRRVAAEQFPNGLPEPSSDDPTQWLYEGRPEASTEPMQVAVARLVGFRWPQQSNIDDLDGFADADGIVCLPSVAGEAPAADRLQQLLAVAYGGGWSPSMVARLLSEAGSRKRNLADWLRDDFFKQHCAVFQNRPFVWHTWDGLKDGFSVLVNYTRLDRKTLEKLTYTYLGTDWVERQRAEARDDVAGAEARLAAALELRRKLELILEGEPPFDIYVRWKSVAEQPVGWDPDLNDGVRLNIRPFVEAGVLRSSPSIHWRKDRGTNPDGGERHNDIHLTLADKTNARIGRTRT